MTQVQADLMAPAHCQVTLRSVDTHAKRNRPQRAPHHLILYFLEANLMMTLEERMLSLVDGCVVLVPAESLYAFAYGSSCRFYCLSFDVPTEMLGELVDVMQHKRPNLLHLQDIAQQARIHQQMEQLQQHLLHPERLPEAVRSVYVNACFTKLLLDVYALQDLCAHRPLQDAHQHLAMQLAAYLDEHFQAPITLDHLEKTFFLSRFHLCRLFRTHTNMTIFEYLRWRKVQAATELLALTDRNIAAIYAESGFLNQQSFYAAFKRHTGKTPLQYRQEARKK